MRYLFILNDPPYGTERSYNAIRHARELLKDRQASSEVRMFLVGDAVSCAKAGQRVPQGYYNVGSMLDALLRQGAAIAVCGSCIDARGIAATDLVPGAERGSMALLAEWTASADKVIVY